MLPRNPTRRGATRVLAIVSRATGKLRRLVDADVDEEYLWHHRNMHSGEAAVYLSHAEHDSLESHEALHDTVAKRAGFDSRPDGTVTRHAVVDPDGVVVALADADPTCGDSGKHYGAGHRLVRHAEARIGWRLVAGKLAPPP